MMKKSDINAFPGLRFLIRCGNIFTHCALCYKYAQHFGPNAPVFSMDLVSNNETWLRQRIVATICSGSSDRLDKADTEKLRDCV